MPDKHYYIEKRSSLRYPVKIPLNYYELDLYRSTPAQTLDISADGLCIETCKEIANGTRLDLYLKMQDDGEQIFRQGKVIWSAILEPSKYKIGVKLDKPNLKPINIVLRALKAKNLPN